MKHRFITSIFIGFVVLGLPVGGWATAKEPIETFVQHTFLHGVPYVSAVQYTSEDAKIIRNIFQDQCINSQEEGPYCSNIAVTLGIIGDASSVPPILVFIGKDRAGLSLPQFRAQTSAVIALGYAVNKTGNQEALNFLKNTLWVDDWKEIVSKTELDQKFPMTKKQLQVQLRRSSIIGLGLSGNQEAMNALRGLLEKVKADRPLRELTREALEANILISANGLVCYYDPRNSECINGKRDTQLQKPQSAE